MTRCAWILRDGAPCLKVVQVDGFCRFHFEMRQALETENEQRALRGEPPLRGRPRDRFLRRFSHARRVAKRKAILEFGWNADGTVPIYHPSTRTRQNGAERDGTAGERVKPVSA
jgi:hypothetical protein